MQKLNDFPFHHIGFAVRSFEDSCPAFEALGAKFFREVSDVERNLDFQFARIGGVLIELISPHDPTLPCAVTNMIEKQSCTPYHISLKTHDLDAELKELRDKGFRQIGKIITSDIYGYEAMGVFLFNKGMGIVELVQECERDE